MTGPFLCVGNYSVFLYLILNASFTLRMYYSLLNLLLFFLIQLASVPEFIVYCLYFFYCSLTLPIFPAASFTVEKLVQQKYISEPVSYSSLIIADQQLFFTMKMNCSHRIFLAIWILGFSLHNKFEI